MKKTIEVSPEWEIIRNEYDESCQTDRMPVIGGWLVRTFFAFEQPETQFSVSMVFVPDANHDWEL